jgi:hypothetical protein
MTGVSICEGEEERFEAGPFTITCNHSLYVSLHLLLYLTTCTPPSPERLRHARAGGGCNPPDTVPEKPPFPPTLG